MAKFIKSLAVALLCATNCPLPALAADKEGNHAVWGVGGKSCFHYGQAQGQPEAESYRDFAMGYLTAYDAMTADTYSIGDGKDLDQIMAWITDY